MAFVSVAVFALVGSVGTGAAPASASAQSSDVGAYLSKMNALRASVGAPPLQLDANLSSLAQSWAQHLADQGSLAHAGDLSAGVSAPWSKLGENVGMGPDTNTVFNAFVNSPAHYQNLVDPSFTSVGIGVVWVGSLQFTAHRFMAVSSAGGGSSGQGSGSSSGGGGSGRAPAPSSGDAVAAASDPGATNAGASVPASPERVAPAPAPEPVTPPPATPERIGAIVAALRAIPT